MWNRVLMVVLFVAVLFAVVVPGGLSDSAIADEETHRVSVERPALSDWPQWRGPTRDGVADAGQSPPTEWAADENIVWKSPIPGRGHSSPIVLGDQVFIATADTSRNVQSLLCYDRLTGKQRWEAVAHEGGMESKLGRRRPNVKATWASSTPITDGVRVFINFLNGDAIYLTAFSLAGETLWQEKVCDYALHQGYGSSPAIYDDLVIVTADNKAGGAIVAFDRETGERVWSRERPKDPNYPSPIVHHLDGRDQLIQTGCDRVISLDPSTGELLWKIDGATTECVSTTVTDGRYVFSSGGYPRDHVAAYTTDGSEKVVWDLRLRVYVPSMLERDGYLYLILDAGVAMCLRIEDGKTMWKGRLGGDFTSSPVRVGDLIYVTNETGTTFIYKATPERFEKVGENELGDGAFASPAICSGQILIRVVEGEGVEGDEAGGEGRERKEFLYCIGAAE